MEYIKIMRGKKGESEAILVRDRKTGVLDIPTLKRIVNSGARILDDDGAPAEVLTEILKYYRIEPQIPIKKPSKICILKDSDETFLEELEMERREGPGGG